MDLTWLRICAAGQTGGCVEPLQAAYLAALLAGAVLFVCVARRSRDLSTAVLTLIPVAIAIDVAVGSLTVALRLPIYLDSVGTVLVGVLAGPWAGALTGLLANLVWSILPIPGGGGPSTAFFAPVAGVIGLMAGFWGSRGVFRLRPGDTRVGAFLALGAGVAAAATALAIIGQTIGLSFSADDLASQTRFVTLSLAIVATGLAAAWITGRTIFRFRPGDPHIHSWLAAETGLFAGAIVFLVLRLLFAPNGYFSTVTGLRANGTPDPFLGGANLSGLAWSDDLGLYVAVAIGISVGVGAWLWASRGENARLFPVWVGGLTTGLVGAVMGSTIAAGVYGGVTGGGTDALVALYRTLGLGVFQSAFAQGLTSDPLDKTMSYTIVFAVIVALPVTVRTMFARGETTVAD